MRISWRNFHGLLETIIGGCGTPPNSEEKFFTDDFQTLKSVKVFFLKSFPLYGSIVCILPFLIFADIMMARGIVRECVQDVDRLAAMASASSSNSSNSSIQGAPSSSSSS